MKTYEQRYKEALERARIWKEKSGMPKDKQGILDDIFPDLKKSEDELVREELIHFLETCQDTRLVANRKQEKWIEWLEKQGGQEPVDKVESKFKVGDWIVDINFPRRPYKVIEVYESWYETIDVDGFHYSISFKCEAKFRPWTIQDAKNGDVLCYRNDIFLLDYYKLFSKVRCHCCYSERLMPYNIYSFTRADFSKIHPATREQCDFLFQKMKNAGYGWDSGKKELIEYE